jgi:hypothetical protein
MIGDLGILAIASAALTLAVLAPAFSNPGGVLALCVPRRRRYMHRHRLATRRWRPRPRSRQHSSRISERLRRMVERADRYRCVGCGVYWLPSQKRFAVDHMVPWIMGGLTCLWNSALLCQTCNSVKSCYWVAPSGQVYYRGRKQPPPQAAEILRRELAARRSLWRWLRAYGLLP